MRHLLVALLVVVGAAAVPAAAKDSTAGSVYAIQVPSGKRHVLYTLPPEARAVDISPDRKRFVIVTGDERIEIVGRNGGGERQIAQLGALVVDRVTWSPNGRWITLEGYDASSCGPQAFNCATRLILLVRPDGTGLHAIDHAVDPAWSHDGRRLAFVGRYSTPDESGYVTVMRPDGTDRHRLSDYVAASGIAFASAGDRLAYAVDDPGGPRIVVQTLSGRPTGGFNEAKMPAWEPHERAMAFVRDRGRAGAERLVFYDGRRFHLIATGDIRFPSWAPDRRWIGWTGGGALSVAGSLKGRSHLLAISSGGIDVLAWSSDSSELFAVEWPSS